MGNYIELAKGIKTLLVERRSGILHRGGTRLQYME
jgi:hypothetical protein